MEQRDRRPKAAQERAEEYRKRKALMDDGYDINMADSEKLLKMVGGTKDEVWKSNPNEMKRRTELATKVRLFYCLITIFLYECHSCRRLI
jgi:hypothetical protein